MSSKIRITATSIAELRITTALSTVCSVVVSGSSATSLSTRIILVGATWMTRACSPSATSREVSSSCGGRASAERS